MAEGLRVVTAFDGDEGEQASEPPKSKKLFHYTDLGNAMRLLKNHADDLLYCAMHDSWYVWDGMRFARDEKKRIEQRAKATTEWMHKEELKRFVDDPKARIELYAHAIRSESAGRIASMIKLAESDERVAILPSDLDTEPSLFNVKNGVLDLRTGELRRHDRANRITKLSPVEYDAQAEAPTWLKFLDRAMDGSQAKIDYLQRWFGYCMTGETTEEVLLFMWGSGRNGKTKCIQAIEHVLGDYSQTTQAETIMRRERKENSNDIAVLAGARMVSTSEIEDGARMAESLVKQLTGGDRVTARRLYGEYFSFPPTFKLVIAGNHKPIIRGTDNAIWERIHLVPFTVTIPTEERDPQLGKKLKAEAPGILNWMLAGCLQWQAVGLRPPQEVLMAIRDYRGEMDTIGGFIDQCCYAWEPAWTLASSLYKAYQEWCTQSGERPVSQVRFGMAMSEKNFIKDREPAKSRRAIWRGLGLLADGDPPPAQAELAELNEADEEQPF